jgi:hypothetical protein
MYRMGRLASIQPVTSAILKIMSHLVMFLRKGGPFYLIHDWLPKHVVSGVPANSPKPFSCLMDKPTSFIAFSLSNYQQPGKFSIF